MSTITALTSNDSLSSKMNFVQSILARKFHNFSVDLQYFVKYFVNIFVKYFVRIIFEFVVKFFLNKNSISFFLIKIFQDEGSMRT